MNKTLDGYDRIQYQDCGGKLESCPVKMQHRSEAMRGTHPFLRGTDVYVCGQTDDYRPWSYEKAISGRCPLGLMEECAFLRQILREEGFRWMQKVQVNGTKYLRFLRWHPTEEEKDVLGDIEGFGDILSSLFGNAAAGPGSTKRR